MPDALDSAANNPTPQKRGRGRPRKYAIKSAENSDLNQRQQKFAAEYVKSGNATRAAIKAGYSVDTAYAQSHKLLKHVGIAAKIQRIRDASLRRIEVSNDRVVQEIARIAFSDVRRLFDEDGQLKPVKDWSDEDAAAVKSIQVVRRPGVGKDEPDEYVHKIMLWDKPTALQKLGDHMGMFERKVNVTGNLTLEQLVMQAVLPAPGDGAPVAPPGEPAEIEGTVVDLEKLTIEAGK